jgi:hypothetical protein
MRPFVGVLITIVAIFCPMGTFVVVMVVLMVLMTMTMLVFRELHLKPVHMVTVSHVHNGLKLVGLRYLL